jgi:hypothetical protein
MAMVVSSFAGGGQPDSISSTSVASIKNRDPTLVMANDDIVLGRYLD